MYIWTTMAQEVLLSTQHVREVLKLEQGAPASFTEAPQYPRPKPLYYGASFVHHAVGSDGERLSALQIAFGVIFEKQVFFLSGLQLLIVLRTHFEPIPSS